MRHAFDQPGLDSAAVTRAQGDECPTLTRRDAVLLITALPPVLLVVWLCSIQHNFQRGASAVRHAAGLGPAEGLPLFVAGSAAGFVLVLGVTIIGGTATAAGVLDRGKFRPERFQFGFDPLLRFIHRVLPFRRPGQSELECGHSLRLHDGTPRCQQNRDICLNFP